MVSKTNGEANWPDVLDLLATAKSTDHLEQRIIDAAIKIIDLVSAEAPEPFASVGPGARLLLWWNQGHNHLEITVEGLEDTILTECFAWNRETDESNLFDLLTLTEGTKEHQRLLLQLEFIKQNQSA